MIINKYWTSKGFSSGFGDLINYISYEYINVKEPTTINWHLQPRTHRQIKRVLKFFKPNELVAHEFLSHSIKDEEPHGSHPHDYWPAKELHQPGDYVAIWLYLSHVGKSFHHQDKVVNKVHLEMLLKSLKRNGYKVVIIPSLGNENRSETLYNINYDFDQYGYCITNILKNCKFSICSEGGIAHLSRLMRVPTLVYFNQTMPWKGHEHYDLREFWITKYSRPIDTIVADVAQTAEQLICNQQVTGSIPVISSKEISV